MADDVVHASPSALRSERVDTGTGVRERVGFVEVGNGQMFVARHEPLEAPRAGVVVCPSMHAELLANYRREVDLARVLAARGLAVQRFHYRSSGNSGGHTADLVFGSMVDDAAAAAALLVADGVETVAFMGARVGTLVAAAVAADHPGAPLALWAPVPDGRKYFREVLRALLIADLRDGASEASPSARLTERLESEGMIDVLGYPIHRELVDSISPLELRGLPGAGARPVLVVQIDRRTALRPPVAAVVEAWRTAGLDVDVEMIADDEAWWLEDDPVRRQGDDDADRRLVDRTAAWLQRACGADATVALAGEGAG